jgi:hypothetical protein
MTAIDLAIFALDQIRKNQLKMRGNKINPTIAGLDVCFGPKALYTWDILFHKAIDELNAIKDSIMLDDLEEK